MNVLIDTNVLISAALRDRLPEQVVRYVATNTSCRWIVTAEIIAEYLAVLRRPKFGLAPDICDGWSALIEAATVFVPSQPIEVQFERDPKDAIFLVAAIVNKADVLVTGDKDLLAVRPQLETKIVSVAEFAAQFQMI